MEHKSESRLPVTKNLFSMRVAGASLALLALATVWCSVRGRSDGAREVVHAREDGDGQGDAEELSITKAEQYTPVEVKIDKYGYPEGFEIDDYDYLRKPKRLIL